VGGWAGGRVGGWVAKPRSGILEFETPVFRAIYLLVRYLAISMPIYAASSYVPTPSHLPRCAPAYLISLCICEVSSAIYIYI
jgi:hypothetical protein